jgi:hypothetical protein
MLSIQQLNGPEVSRFLKKSKFSFRKRLIAAGRASVIRKKVLNFLSV